MSNAPSGEKRRMAYTLLIPVQTTGVNDIRYLVELAEHAAQHLQVVDLDRHIDGGDLLFNVAAAGDAQHVDFFIGQNGGDIA